MCHLFALHVPSEDTRQPREARPHPYLQTSANTVLHNLFTQHIFPTFEMVFYAPYPFENTFIQYMLKCNTKCLFSESPSAVKVVIAVVNLAGRFNTHGITVFWRSAGREERDAPQRRDAFEVSPPFR